MSNLTYMVNRLEGRLNLKESALKNRIRYVYNKEGSYYTGSDEKLREDQIIELKEKRRLVEIPRSLLKKYHII